MVPRRRRWRRSVDAGNTIITMLTTPHGASQVSVLRWQDGTSHALDDWVCDEVPVALEFNGISHAVMLATPCDLEDFALGFGLSEGIFENASELYGCEVEVGGAGVTVRMDVSARSFAGLKQRRRTLAGRTGCGVCGTESLAEVLRPVPVVSSGMRVQAEAIVRAMRSMKSRQILNALTGSTHAAAWCDLHGDIHLLREDVGRHNALDKLIGALAYAPLDRDKGFIAVTSRASIEMVQKAAVAKTGLLVAVSAPTQLAVTTAQQAGMGLVGLVRQDGLVIYTQPDRVLLPAPAADQSCGQMKERRPERAYKRQEITERFST
jgi:FdhD protein